MSELKFNRAMGGAYSTDKRIIGGYCIFRAESDRKWIAYTPDSSRLGRFATLHDAKKACNDHAGFMPKMLKPVATKLYAYACDGTQLTWRYSGGTALAVARDVLELMVMGASEVEIVSEEGTLVRKRPDNLEKLVQPSAWARSYGTQGSFPNGWRD